MSFRNVNVSHDTGPSPPPFDRPVLLTHTADGDAARKVAAAYAAAGVGPEAQSTHALDASTLRLLDRALGWEASRPDLLGAIHRVTLPLSGYEAAFDAFKTLTFPVRIYVAAEGATAGAPLAPTIRPRAAAARLYARMHARRSRFA